jgi:hypothetical protein
MLVVAGSDEPVTSDNCATLLRSVANRLAASTMSGRLIQILHGDAEMRAELINKVAVPIANKMFECGLIP